MHRRTCQCIIPPYMMKRLAASGDPAVRAAAIDALQADAAARARREVRSRAPGLGARRSATGHKERLIYDAAQREQLPGALVRREGDAAGADSAVNEAHDGSGAVYDFYAEFFGRNSLDDAGMSLISTVHYGRRFNNAFWDGSQMTYGDGDRVIFDGFTKSIDVIAHELTHGVVTHTCNLEYWAEPGALNEHFADVFGSLVRQWTRNETPATADWLIGSELIVPAANRPHTYALRTLKAEKAYRDDPYLGDDPQPKHVSDKYEGDDDNAGVHINSGIPNHAFYRFATALGGRSWETAGHVWYRTMLGLTWRSKFRDMVETSNAVAIQLHGNDSAEHRALREAWAAVGL